ncbi:MAG: polymer-forming cytoskeletal protein [Peptococcaceae bacterium]|jgi:cytoskeletal protein CcmA (bactofilin family)|nr:polymer-forming cytoskeletal protein [Peptococcaceae bacterium]
MARDKSEAVGTIISEDCRFEGNIRLETSIRIDGCHIGDVMTEGDVYIGDHGSCTGNISSRNLYICGAVKGDVIAKGRIELSGKSKLRGNATMGNLVMEEGAEFMGSCRTLNTLNEGEAYSAS